MWKRAVSSIVLAGVVVVASSCGPNLEDHWNNPSTFPYPDEPPASIDVLSYNVFLRPGSISTRDHTRCRGRAIGQRLADMQPDIVALQESWEQNGVESLVNESEHRLPFRVLSKPQKRLLDNATGGLSILSKWPIEDVRTLRYEDCNGEDCYASKGILHAVIRVSEVSSIQVVTTHMDAGSELGDRQARASQLDYVFTQAGEWRLIRHETEHLAMPAETCGDDVTFLSDHRVVSTQYGTLF